MLLLFRILEDVAVTEAVKSFDLEALSPRVLLRF
jgi:hypothetical protein